MQDLQNHRDKYLKQRRRQHFQRIISKQRYNLHKKFQQMDQQHFFKTYPIINEFNFHIYKHQLAKFVINPQYSYQISIFAPLLHDYLIQYPNDSDSVNILKFITQFEDIQLPQTAQLAHCLTLLTHSSLIDSLLIVSNLLTFPRYQSILRDRLLQSNYIQQVDQLLLFNENQDTEIYNLAVVMYSEILCSMLTSTPLLPLTKISNFIAKIKKLAYQQQVKWSIMHAFTAIRQRVKLNSQYAELLLNQFETFIIQQRHWAYLHVFDLLLYAAYSQIYSSNKQIIQLIQNSISNLDSIRSQVFIKGLQCLYVYIKQYQLDLQNNEIQNLLMALILTSDNPKCQQIILNVLETVRQSDLVEALAQHQNKHQIIYQLVKCLEGFTTRNTALSIILTFVINQEYGFKQQFEQHGIKKILQSIYSNIHDETLRNQLQTLLNELNVNTLLQCY